jgi:hypothetical protein
MTANHTPTPWAVGQFDDSLGYDCMTAGITVGPVTLDGNDYGQAPCRDMTVEQRARMEADAHFIARAVNCHEELLAALKGLLSVRWSQAEGMPEADAADAAIDKAEGRS